jgi:anti-sigma regulatory factor (Ser/Thr protein kinase)
VARARSRNVEARSPAASDELEFVLPAKPAAVAEARRALADFLDAAPLPDETTANLFLLTSELVTNAIMHGSREGDEVGIRYARRPGCLRISVDDAARAASVPQVLSQDPERTSGRGLGLIDRMADRWGEQIVSGRNVVWFEIDVDPHA